MDDVNPPTIPPRTANWKDNAFADRISKTQIMSTNAKTNGNLMSNSAAVSVATQPLVLDASALLQQPSRYVNVSVKDTADPINASNARTGAQINC